MFTGFTRYEGLEDRHLLEDVDFLLEFLLVGKVG
jgi:hypothetical protein